MGVPPDSGPAGAPGDLGLPRARRIRKAAEYKRVSARGQRFRTPHFVVVCAPADEGQESRLGLVVSRKVGNAVARNRVKRRVRESFRHWRPDLRDRWSCVVIAQSGAADLAGPQVDAELRGLVAWLNRRGTGAARGRGPGTGPSGGAGPSGTGTERGPR